MRERRLKVDPDKYEAVYNLMSRIVNRERLLDSEARDRLMHELLVVAEYCGLDVITFAVMSSHFHAEVGVPVRQPLTDGELLRRMQLLHPKPNRYWLRRLESIRTMLEKNGPGAAEWRLKQMAKTSDISEYMKLVKQRFTVWFNKRHERVGTLWAERFKSVLVEPMSGALKAIAAYIDLNCVRAGLAVDPKEYRWCGYARAVAGDAKLQAQLTKAMGEPIWEEAQAAYRLLLFASGTEPRQGKASIPLEDLQKVLMEGGRLPPATILRCRLRYLTQGVAIGSESFVRSILEKYRKKAHAVFAPFPSGEDLAVNRMRGAVIG